MLLQRTLTTSPVSLIPYRLSWVDVELEDWEENYKKNERIVLRNSISI